MFKLMGKKIFTILGSKIFVYLNLWIMNTNIIVYQMRDSRKEKLKKNPFSTLFLQFTINFISYLICLCTLEAYSAKIWTIRSSLIKVHKVCFHEKIQSGIHFNICSRRKKQAQLFSGQKILAVFGLENIKKKYLPVS